jgi:dipeptidyl aminopeptidase/acylaminoacyl peptidase
MMTSHVTPRILVAMILSAIVLGVSVIAQQVAEPELLLQEALHKQQVQGDLPGAIKIYQQIVSARNGNRAMTARALLELAGCYEKLGQQAETVYQQIVRDFGDQPAAAQARARLSSLRSTAPATTMTLRRLEHADGIADVIATDGHNAVFYDQQRTLYFGDLSGRNKRILTQTTQVRRLIPSRDLSSVLAVSVQTPVTVSVIKTDGTGERALDLRENGHPLTLNGLGPLRISWSWDNRSLLLVSPGEAGSRLLKISVADGIVTEILPGYRDVFRAEFSPDGRFIAYHLGQPQGGAIYVMPSSGGESQPVATDAELGDWTRDGRHVLVRGSAADDGGTILSAIPVHNGRKDGERIPLRSIPGQQVRMMINGSLFVSTGDVPFTVRDTWLGTVDDTRASITWMPLNLVGSPIPTTLFTWLSDANRFAYVTGAAGQTTRVVRVKDISNGDDRELYRGDRVLGCVAAHREAVIYCGLATAEATQIVSVSLDSGRTETRGAVKAGPIVQQMTSDDRKIVIFSALTGQFVEWEIGTGEEHRFPLYRSEDARWTLTEAIETEPKNALRIRPATGEESWRVLVTRRVPFPGFSAIPVAFSPDGNGVLYHDRDAAGRDGLYRIATTGGDPQRLGDYPTSLPTSALSVSPDGRHFVVHAPTTRRAPERDYWVLENFLPAASPSPSATAKDRTDGSASRR